MTPERALKAVVERLETENEHLKQKIKRLQNPGTRAAPLDIGEWYVIKERYGLTPVQAQMVLLMAKRGAEFTSPVHFMASIPRAPSDVATLRVQMSGIRRALKSHGVGLQTARGFGYRLIGWPS
jgi:DNA-binding response OmpR family regulator